MTKDSNKTQPSGLSRFNLLAIVLIIIVAVVYESKQQRVTHMLIESLNSIDRLQQPIDFSSDGIQQLSDGFMLSRASQKKHLTGIKFKGRVVNTQSVDHHNVTFSLSVDGEDKEFVINKISSGNSTGFNIYIPDLKIENARYAQIKYVRSSISYYTK